MDINQNPTLVAELNRFKITFTGTGKKFSYCSKDCKKYSVPIEKVNGTIRAEIIKLFTDKVVNIGNEVFELDRLFITNNSEEMLREFYDKLYDVMHAGSPGFRRNISRLK